MCGWFIVTEQFGYLVQYCCGVVCWCVTGTLAAGLVLCKAVKPSWLLLVTILVHVWHLVVWCKLLSSVLVHWANVEASWCVAYAGVCCGHIECVYLIGYLSVLVSRCKLSWYPQAVISHAATSVLLELVSLESVSLWSVVTIVVILKCMSAVTLVHFINPSCTYGDSSFPPSQAHTTAF